jgi:hypothetical protein
MLRSWFMRIAGIFLAMGEDKLRELLRHVSMSRLRTYQIFEHIKTRTRLTKLNSEHLRNATPRLWARISENDEDLAADLAQAILVSNLDMIIAALNELGIPHQDGFFAKDADVASFLKDGWQQSAFDKLKDQFPPVVLEFYLNHLAVETTKSDSVFTPA